MDDGTTKPRKLKPKKERANSKGVKESDSNSGSEGDIGVKVPKKPPAKPKKTTEKSPSRSPATKSVPKSSSRSPHNEKLKVKDQLKMEKNSTADSSLEIEASAAPKTSSGKQSMSRKNKILKEDEQLKKVKNGDIGSSINTSECKASDEKLNTCQARSGKKPLLQKRRSSSTDTDDSVDSVSSSVSSVSLLETISLERVGDIWKQLGMKVVSLGVVAILVLSSMFSGEYEPAFVAGIGYDIIERIYDDSVLLKNQTLIYANGTRIQMDAHLTYFDKAQCSASRRSRNDAAIWISFLNLDPQVHPVSYNEQFCGFLSEEKYSTWSGMLETQSPVFFPENDTQVQNIVNRIRDAGCKVRPIGSRQSDSGISISATDDLSVGVSLSKYNSNKSAPDWSLQYSVLKISETMTIRAEGGLTLRDIYATIRPLGYFLPTVVDDWALSVGTVVGTMVHGSTFGKSYLNSYVTSLRVMLGNGTISELRSPLDLAMWRNSMGLLGLVLSAEFKVEKRDSFSMGTQRTVVHQWNPWYLDSVISEILPGSSGSQYFFDGWTDELLGVGHVDYNTFSGVFLSNCRVASYTSDDDCTFNVKTVSCNTPEFCEYRFKMGDILPSHSCRLVRKPNPTLQEISKNYEKWQDITSKARGLGTPSFASADLNKPRSKSSMHHSGSIDDASQAAWMDDIENHVHRSRENWNDGMWTMAKTKSVRLWYFFPLKSMFFALDIYRTIVRESVIRKNQFQFRDQPLMFQFVQFDHQQVLQPHDIRTGDYVSLCVTIELDTDNAWKQSITELETRWKDHFVDLPIFPHISHVHGFSQNTKGESTTAENLYRRARRVKSIFERFKKHVDNRLENSGVYSGYFARPPTFEETLGLEDPSIAMIDAITDTLLVEDPYMDLYEIDKIVLDVAVQVESEVEFHGDFREDFLTGDIDKTVPFSNRNHIREMFNDDQLNAFLKYRAMVDPESVFWAGYGTRFFPVDLKYEHTGNLDPDFLDQADLLCQLFMTPWTHYGEDYFGLGSILFVALFSYAAYRGIALLCKTNKKRKKKKWSLSDSDNDSSEESSEESSSSNEESSDEESESSISSSGR